jgi:hypothetical protein
MPSCIDSFNHMYDDTLAVLCGFFNTRGSSTDWFFIPRTPLPTSKAVSMRIHAVEMERSHSFHHTMVEVNAIMAEENKQHLTHESFLALPLEERAKIAAKALTTLHLNPRTAAGEYL